MLCFTSLKLRLADSSIRLGDIPKTRMASRDQIKCLSKRFSHKSELAFIGKGPVPMNCNIMPQTEVDEALEHEFLHVEQRNRI